MQAVVLAGGRGTRLGKGGESALPKALFPLAGLPVIDHLVGALAQGGVDDVLILTGFRADAIAHAVGDGARYGVRVRCLAEPTPLGTAGAVRAAAAHLDERFLVVYGDLVLDVDLPSMMGAHRAAGALATLAVHPNDHPFDSDRVITDGSGWIRRFVRTGEAAGPEAGALASAALYLVERTALDTAPAPGGPEDFARGLFPRLLEGGARLLAWRTAEYIKDMGTPERAARVDDDLRGAVPSRLRRSAPKPAVLLDRDGVLVEDRPYITDAAELRLLSGAAAALARLNRAHRLSVVCTNQPVVARGALDEEGLHALHRHLEGQLGAEGAWLDGIFVCPHHPDRGFAGERADLKRECACRKPRAGLVDQADSALGIDRRASILVGDRTADLACARAAGLLGVGVLTGAACRDGRHPLPPETPLVPSLAEAVALVLDEAPWWRPRLGAVREARVVALGGPSRAGKTVAAAALALELRSAGVEVLHLGLDRFIQPASERRPGATLRERTRFADAALAIRQLLDGQSVLVPGYDSQKRARAPSEVRALGPGQVLLVDGLLALALELPGALRVAIEAPLDERLARRRAFYAWKGLSGHALEAEVTGGAAEAEEAEVAETLARADLRRSLDGALRPGEVP